MQRYVVGSALIVFLTGIIHPAIFERGAAWGAEYDRPAANPHQSRSVVVAQHGIVATSQPLAAQVGLDVLKRGGNAADAAIATNAMLGVVEPMDCGIGGDLFAIYWDAKTEKLYGLNASGRSPYKLSREEFRKKGLTKIPSEGLLPWSVPGCVAGWEDLRERFGTRPLAELLQPSIEYADGGAPVSEVIAQDWKGSEQTLGDWPDSAKTFLPGGHAPATGELFRNPNLAASYRLLANEGRAAFYKGEIARQIVAFSESHGGYFSMRDFAEHKSEWVEPVSTNYRGYDVWELPPNGQGIAGLEMLNLLEPYDLRSMGRGSAEYLHRFLEAKKLAFADRARFYADPAFHKLPVAELISKPYADNRRKLINLDRAATNVPAGNPRLERGDTIYLTVVDKDRNCCSLIQSIFWAFGSQVVPGNVGFAMQNRGELFALDETHLNRLEPHKRPFHTIIPAFVTKDNKPWLCFGVMGGDMQAQGHVQVLVDLIDFDMNVQEAGDEPRVRHDGSATPTGEPAESGGGSVAVESGIRAEVVEALKRKGHKISSETDGFGGYQAILIDWKNGVLHGATEPRKDGCAAGY
ncbi:MAG: gamma-glutamyltransferase [Planctomycetia bacterium]|nr:gamma-glutamyltransferase [Planctomycetia bacterium]